MNDYIRNKEASNRRFNEWISHNQCIARYSVPSKAVYHDSVEYRYRNIGGHIEVFDDNGFIGSYDSVEDFKNEK